MFSERRGGKKNEENNDHDAETRHQPIIEKAIKNRIYTHLHFFYNDLLEADAYVWISEAKTIFADKPFPKSFINLPVRNDFHFDVSTIATADKIVKKDNQYCI
jgi:hypothetical protein